MEISKSKLKSGDLLETMRFSYCADRESFVDSFAKIGLPIKSESDLILLNKWHNEGWDKAGMIKNSKGDNLVIDIKHFVNYNIKLRHNKVLQCKIKFIN
ncbi:MAG TPA: hypothetical protein PKD00_08380 [Burkholderiales bacterium]|nr:hypothetical protein [Burkholderiales bacterium]